MTDKKKFGLVMPKKAEKLKMQINFAFNVDSDEDEVSNKHNKISQKKIESKYKFKTESVEDPSIFEYDSIYDEMKSKQTESIAPKEKKNSRYIETLMKAAEKRKKEYERRVEKKIQAEREKEGDKYQDKEAFVTSSYKKKMQEQEEEEEKERRENMLNDMMDVSKQMDLSGFYRHFLKQTVGEEKIPVFGEKEIKEKIVSDKDDSHKYNESVKDNKNIDQDSDGIEIDDDENLSSDEKSDSENQNKKISSKSLKTCNDLNILNKKSSDCGSQKVENMKWNFHDNESKTFKIQRHTKRSYRKSSESSILDASDNENNILSSKKGSYSDKHKKSKKNNETNVRDKSRHDSSSDDDNEKTANVESDNCINEENKRVNIYTKRTVGDVFAESQARYFQRMATRNAGNIIL